MNTMRKKVAILISGRGSNMAALIDAAADRSYPAEIVGVISDRADALGLGIAASRGIATQVIAKGDFATKDAHDSAIDKALVGMGADIVALAGYMRLFTPGFVTTWQGRMINVHPSLLPSFKGLDSHRRALEAGVRVHGCSVHFVTADMDSGPIIAQAAVTVRFDDTEERLASRVLAAEHHLYPLALRLVAEGKARMEGDRTVLADASGVSENGEALFSPSAIREAVDLEALARFTP